MSVQRLEVPRNTDSASVSHYYCERDPQLTTPMCGATKPGAETGTDCPLCELVVTNPINCAFCGGLCGTDAGW